MLFTVLYLLNTFDIVIDTLKGIFSSLRLFITLPEHFDNQMHPQTFIQVTCTAFVVALL